MLVTHSFHTPRNLYEKLTRDAQKLDMEISGDNMFNFLSTACHLSEWIKKSAPTKSNETIKRINKMLQEDENLKLCKEILKAAKHFEIVIDEKEKSVLLVAGNQKTDAIGFKNNILNLYTPYFQIKGEDVY